MLFAAACLALVANLGEIASMDRETADRSEPCCVTGVVTSDVAVALKRGLIAP